MNLDLEPIKARLEAYQDDPMYLRPVTLGQSVYKLIRNAPTDIDALVQEVERLREQLDIANWDKEVSAIARLIGEALKLKVEVTDAVIEYAAMRAVGTRLTEENAVLRAENETLRTELTAEREYSRLQYADRVTLKGAGNQMAQALNNIRRFEDLAYGSATGSGLALRAWEQALAGYEPQPSKSGGEE